MVTARGGRIFQSGTDSGNVLERNARRLMAKVSASPLDQLLDVSNVRQNGQIELLSGGVALFEQCTASVGKLMASLVKPKAAPSGGVTATGGQGSGTALDPARAAALARAFAAAGVPSPPTSPPDHKEQ